MWRVFMFVLYLLAVAVSARAQDTFQVGNIYFGVVIYSESKDDAELLAAAYLNRGEIKTLTEENRKKYHCEVSTLIYAIIETTEALKSDKGEVLFLIRALSTKMIYIISPIPALPSKPLPHKSRDDTSIHIFYIPPQTPIRSRSRTNKGVRHEIVSDQSLHQAELQDPPQRPSC